MNIMKLLSAISSTEREYDSIVRKIKRLLKSIRNTNEDLQPLKYSNLLQEIKSAEGMLYLCGIQYNNLLTTLNTTQKEV